MMQSIKEHAPCSHCHRFEIGFSHLEFIGDEYWRVEIFFSKEGE